MSPLMGLGPYGARGIGEPPIGPSAAAIANAVHDATGVRPTRLPMRPEMVWRLIRDTHQESESEADGGGYQRG